MTALHNGYGSILIHLRQPDQCAALLLIGIALFQQGLILCAILDLDAAKGAAGQGHWNTLERTQFPVSYTHLDYLSLIRKAVEYHLQNDSSKPFGIAVNPFTDIYKLVESLL